MRYYAGIGSRKTPIEVQNKMTKIAEALRGAFCLRSGGAMGADSAFELGAGNNKEIYLPRDTFNGREHDGKLFFNYNRLPRADGARSLTQLFHPVPHVLSDYGIDLMSRNAMQVFGRNLNDPVQFVLIWTSNGETLGGSGQAIRIAEHFKIPIFNMGSPTFDIKKVYNFINTLSIKKKK